MTLLKLFTKLGWDISDLPMDVWVISDNVCYRGFYDSFDMDSDIQLLCTEMKDWQVKMMRINHLRYGSRDDLYENVMVVEL